MQAKPDGPVAGRGVGGRRPRPKGASTVSGAVRKEILDGGLTLLTERMPEFRSVCLGVCLRKGSRDETAAENGITHFIEHLVFKGTETRSAREIAKLFDRFGGHTDASTGREQTWFWAKVLDGHVAEALDLLADIVLRPRFDAGEIERERKVIFEEIHMVEDSPEELVYDLFYDALWGDHPLGRPIQGTVGSVTAMGRDAILDYFRRAYVAGNVIVAAAGSLDHDAIAGQVRRAFAGLPAGDGTPPARPPEIRGRALLREKRDLEQLQLCLGVPAFPMSDPRRYVGAVLNTILGGNPSSRLFQAVREERGLAYSVYSSISGYLDAGYLVISLATAPEQAGRALDVVRAEVGRLRREPAPAAELADAKEHLKGSLMLGLESSSSRMSNLARQEIYFGRQSSLDEVLADIDRVSAEEVQALAGKLLGGPPATLAALGRVRQAGLRPEPLPLD
jgi:predicted Zn-dependent peptidase